MAAPSNTPTTSLKTWKFQEQHVQQNLAGGDFIGSHTCLLCAAAPRMSDMADNGKAFFDTNSDTGADGLGPDFAIPIGVVDNATLGQDRQLAQIFEIGSKRSYLLASRTIGQMTIARVFYKGPNLLRMLYAFYPSKQMTAASGDRDSMILRDIESNKGTPIGTIGLNATALARLPDIRDNPGYNNVILNLNSDLFSQPYGMILYMKDNHENDVAAVYLEECYVANHSMAISANSVVVAENVTMRFERIVPIKVNVRAIAQGSGTTPDILSQLTGALSDPLGAATAALKGVLNQ